MKAGAGAKKPAASSKKSEPAGAKKPRKRGARDIEKIYSTAQSVAKLRRLADALESGRSFAIQVAGERVVVPRDARLTIEHEREGRNEEIEFQLVWKNDEPAGAPAKAGGAQRGAGNKPAPRKRAAKKLRKGAASRA